MSSSTKTSGFVSGNPGRDVQRVGTARFLGQDPYKIHDPVWAVTGTLGDSQCYLGVTRKVEAIQTALAARIERDDLPVRLIAPAFTIGVSDGQLNGTDNMRFSLIGRELSNDSMEVSRRAGRLPARDDEERHQTPRHRDATTREIRPPRARGQESAAPPVRRAA